MKSKQLKTYVVVLYPDRVHVMEVQVVEGDVIPVVGLKTATELKLVKRLFTAGCSGVQDPQPEIPKRYRDQFSGIANACMRLRSLKKAGVQLSDLVGIYCALIRSVLEYAAPVWSGLPVYLSDVLEAVQRRAMRIIFPHADYNTALCSAALNLYRRLGNHLLSTIFSRNGALLTMAINCVQVSSAMSKLKATLRDLILL